MTRRRSRRSRPRPRPRPQPPRGTDNPLTGLFSTAPPQPHTGTGGANTGLFSAAPAGGQEGSGDLLGDVADVATPPVRSGTYRGRLESGRGEALHLELRLDLRESVVSADFFRDGIYYGSLRGRMLSDEEGLFAERARMIFDGQDASTSGGSVEIVPVSEATLDVRCLVPAALPDTYVGQATFNSEYFRVLDIEVDKLAGTPWPPEVSTAEIPDQHKPEDYPDELLSLDGLFRKAGIDARVHFSDGALDAGMGAGGRPGEEDRWDERELHEMMDRASSLRLDQSAWQLYLLTVTRFDGGPAWDSDRNDFRRDDQNQIVNGGRGVTGIIFDHSTGNINDPWSPIADWFRRHQPQLLSLFDFGRQGSFQNSRARQGVAVFWDEMLDFLPGNLADGDRDWYQRRQFLRTIVHELGHALNLAHAWDVGRPRSTSFMMYPHYYPRGGSAATRVHNYWRDFEYAFDPEEIFHFWHGFYDEVIPGGRHEFGQWTPSSIFRHPSAGGTRSNLSLELAAGRDDRGGPVLRRELRFTEPAQLEITVRNHSGVEIPLGRLGPSYGEVRFMIRKPSGEIETYEPPLVKCLARREGLAENGVTRHTTTLLFGRGGFLFDTPGRYEVTAAIPDPSSGTLAVSPPVNLWVCYPRRTRTIDEDRLAQEIFDPAVGLFLYLHGGDHLDRARIALENVAEKYDSHPVAAHACLALGLNKLRRQRRLPSPRAPRPAAETVFRAREAVAPPDRETAAHYLRKAGTLGKRYKTLDDGCRQRLEKTFASYGEGVDGGDR